MLLKSRDEGRPPCRQVRELAAAKLAEMEARLLEITEARDNLRDLLASWDTQLNQADTRKPARLLESPSAADDAIIEKLARVRNGQRSRTKQKAK